MAEVTLMALAVTSQQSILQDTTWLSPEDRARLCVGILPSDSISSRLHHATLQLTQRPAGINSRSLGQAGQRLVVELRVSPVTRQESVDDCYQAGVESQQDLGKSSLRNAISMSKRFACIVYASLIFSANVIGPLAKTPC